jgi:hypothetical protein
MLCATCCAFPGFRSSRKTRHTRRVRPRLRTSVMYYWHITPQSSPSGSVAATRRLRRAYPRALAPLAGEKPQERQSVRTSHIHPLIVAKNL